MPDVPHPKRRELDERELTDLGVAWCQFLFRPKTGPEEAWGKLPDEIVGQLTLHCRQAADPMWLRIYVPPANDGVPHIHAIPQKTRYLKHLNTIISGISWPGHDRVRQYAFHVVLQGLGRIPFQTLTSVGVLLYNLPLPVLAKFFQGKLTPQDTALHRTWACAQAFETNRCFPGAARTRGKGNDKAKMILREADDSEQKDIGLVLDRLSSDLDFPQTCLEQDLELPQVCPQQATGPNFAIFCKAYGEVLKSPHLAVRVRGRWREIVHRRASNIERKAELLVACPRCGGIPLLYDEVVRNLAPLEASARTRGANPLRLVQHLAGLEDSSRIGKTQLELRKLQPLRLHVPDYFGRGSEAR